MKFNDFEISREETNLYVILEFCIPIHGYESNINATMWLFVQNILDEYNISQNNIDNIIFERLKSDKKGQVLVKIKYYKMDILELNSMNKRERIRKVLNYMGYANEDIKDITKEKERYNDECWIATVHDLDYDFNPDESFSARDYEISKNKEISDVLGFTVNIEFI